jgi:hypothetical protein
MAGVLGFVLIEAVTLPIWAVWILFPRGRLARHLARADWPWLLLGAIYGFCLVRSIVVGPPLRLTSFLTLSGVMANLAAPSGTLTAWAHFLCLDSFVGRWMVRQAPEAGYRLSPVLAATVLFAPLGLVWFLLARRRLERP